MQAPDPAPSTNPVGSSVGPSATDTAARDAEAGNRAEPRSRPLRVASALGVLAAVIAAFAAPACVDTQGDYDSYLHRTDTIRGQVQQCSFKSYAQSDSPAGVNPVGTWFASCLPALFADTPQYSLLSIADIAKNGDGTLSVTFSPLDKTKTTFDRANIASTPYGANNVPVAADGSFVVVAGDVTIKGIAERYLDSDVVLSGLQFTMLPQQAGTDTTKDEIVANIDAELLAPQTKSIHGAGNYCVLLRLTPGAGVPMPTFTTAQGATATGFASSAYSCASSGG